MTDSGTIYGVILALLFAVAAGLVGSFALMKRMILAADVISHVALPGLGLAFLLHFNPLLGGGITLFLGTLLIWQLQKKASLSTEVAIGVVFAGSVAIGAVLTPKEDFVEAFFGKFEQISGFTFWLGVFAIALIVYFVLRFKSALILNLFSPELAAATGIKLNRLNLLFLLVFSLTVLIGLRFMGALLAGALIIIPAATGRRLANSISRFLLASSLASLLAVGIGFLLNAYVLHNLSIAPTIVIVSALLFGLSLIRSTA
ncbi:MAG TPA: metal ABC transporter permease [Acidobacteriaceae bacterium]|nr:metal ABC transporter permease [Terriglobia bacterium]HVC90890.1 metal ABC transporter permease [Acidobacteriaceae bacterium]